jgi:glycosyltransferase involved in cell wall biosynthesis
MQQMLFLFILATFLLELLASLSAVRSPLIARGSSFVLVLFHSFLIGTVLIHYFGVAALLVSFFLTFRIVHVSRIARYTMRPKELRLRSVRSTVVLGMLTFLSYALLFQMSIDSLLWPAVVFAGVMSVALFLSTILTMHTYRARKPAVASLQAKLPTVSVCIPARNETQDLPECIETVLASTYPKLEILVLDDCSHDKTPAIIKEYAHKGVRFLSGQEPKDGWLAKNKAMDKLYEESKGEIVLFAGVDVRFSPDTIQQIVGIMQAGNRMVSVLPYRARTSEGSVFIQPLRYWWELAMPRVFMKRPPVLSTAWAVYKKDLKKVGEFDSVKGSVQPEAHFAKRLAAYYHFVISGTRLGLTSVKPPREQFDTAIRTRYPQTKRRPETVSLLLLIELVVFALPLVVLINGLISDQSATLTLLAGFSVVLLVVVNLLISYVTVRRTWLVGLFSLPFLLFEEWYIVLRSMLAYEFGTVIWKERNICLPMLRVEKSLPPLDKSNGKF